MNIFTKGHSYKTTPNTTRPDDGRHTSKIGSITVDVKVKGLDEALEKAKELRQLLDSMSVEVEQGRQTGCEETHCPDHHSPRPPKRI